MLHPRVRHTGIQYPREPVNQTRESLHARDDASASDVRAVPDARSAQQRLEWETPFGDSMPVGANPEEVNLKVNSYTSISFDTADTNTDMVELYATSWCGYCKKAKQYFTENKIKYTEYDIEESLSAKMNYDKLGVSGVPVILYKGKQMSGFSVSGFRRLYNK